MVATGVRYIPPYLIYLFRLYLISVVIKEETDVDWGIVYSSIKNLDRSLRVELGTFQFNVPESDREEMLEHINLLLKLTGGR